MDRNELPLGFGMALAQNTAAMENFARMTEAQQREILSRAHSVNSKAEMHELVQTLI